MKKLGRDEKGRVVYRSANCKNKHMVAMGKSGCGKTLMMLYQILLSARAGERTIIFNWHSIINKNTMPKEMREEYDKYVKVIDVSKGIGIPLFDPLFDDNGDLEDDDICIGRITSLIANSCGLAPTYEAMLYNAVSDIYEENSYSEKGIKAVGDWFLNQDKKTAMTTRTKIISLLEGNCLQQGDFLEDDAMIYELDFNGLGYDRQKSVVDFLLKYIFELAIKGKFIDKPINLYIDEAQNFDFSNNSVIYSAINESRRLDLRLLLSFPSMYAGRKKDMDVITQCGVMFIFSPLDSDRRKIAEKICPKNTDTTVYKLSQLKVGQCLVFGDVEVERSTKEKTITIMADMKEMKKNG